MREHERHWTFGAACHIRFPGGGGPVNDVAHTFISGEGSATISDSNGNLLFHTDGTDLYGVPPANAAINPPSQPLGGESSSTHSAIVIPPAGGGSIFHVFAAGDWATPSHIGPVRYTPVSLTPSLALAAPTAPLPFGPVRSSERLAAVSHRDCRGYWLVTLDLAGVSPGPGRLFTMLIDSDAGPTSAKTWNQAYSYPNAEFGFCMKFSPDGSLLALVNKSGIDILNFDRATGVCTAHSQIVGGPTGNDALYGVEFSPDGKHLYFTQHKSGDVRRHDIPPSGSPPTPVSATASVDAWTGSEPWSNTARVGALQLAPNGRIYGAKYAQSSLFEIADPDNGSAAGVQFASVALDGAGLPLTLGGTSYLGLPSFTRIAGDCADLCGVTAAIVAEEIEADEKVNDLAPCRGELPAPRCEPAPLPDFEPQIFIRWGDSRCDCIEGDDTEIMHLTICNPWSNLALSNLTVQQLVVVDASGNPVPTLPNGDPSIELVPRGPYCFDDIAPCACVTREFVLRLRGAPGGPYRILVRGICFDICLHQDTDACFRFDVCPD